MISFVPRAGTSLQRLQPPRTSSGKTSKGSGFEELCLRQEPRNKKALKTDKTAEAFLLPLHFLHSPHPVPAFVNWNNMPLRQGLWEGQPWDPGPGSERLLCSCFSP